MYWDNGLVCHTPIFGHLKNVKQSRYRPGVAQRVPGVQIIQLLVMQSPPFPRYLVPPRSKYSPLHHILKHSQLPFLSQCQRPSFTSRIRHSGRRQNVVKKDDTVLSVQKYKYLYISYKDLMLAHSKCCKRFCLDFYHIPSDMLSCTGCPRRNVQDFGRVLLMLKYTDITQNTYIQS